MTVIYMAGLIHHKVMNMLFDCEFCDEKGMELSEGKIGTPWHPTKDWMPTIVMKCIHCGVSEPCESDDLVGFMMEILQEKDYHLAMLKALRILWNETYLKEMVE